MKGIVNSKNEAQMTLRIIGPFADEFDILATVDTGFDGDLILPQSMIDALMLSQHTTGYARMVHGRTGEYGIFNAVIEWDGQQRHILVSALGHEPLAGMKLLAGHRITIDVIRGGTVDITLLSG